MIRKNITDQSSNRYQSSSLWQRCSTLRALKQVHARMLANGFNSDRSALRELIFTSAISIAGTIDYAHRLFADITEPDLFMWNTMIRGSAPSANPLKSIVYYKQMEKSRIKPDNYTFPHLLKACTKLCWVKMGHEVHGTVLKFGFESNTFVRNTLIHFHAKCGDLGIARVLFDGSAKQDVVAWSALTAGYARRGELSVARQLFDEMPVKDLVSWNVMITGYAKQGEMESARGLFDEVPKRDVVTWNAMIAGYVRLGSYKQALEMFEEMRSVGERPDEVTMLSLLSACADLGDLDVGQKIHGSLLEMFAGDLNVLLGNALIDMYAKCGQGTQIYSLRSGWSNHEEQAFAEALVFLTDRTASLCFHSTGHGDPAILSIEILQVDDKAYHYSPGWGQGIILRTAKRLSCGAEKPKFDVDYNGDPWGGDRFWNPITTFGQSSDRTLSAKNSIKQASVAPNFYPEALYETALVSTDNNPDLEYTLDVDPNRNYSVWLHFAEIDSSVTGVGQRVFDILLNGDIAFRDIDIVKMSGDRYAALVLNKTVAVNGRTLTITMHPTKGNHALINAIEVFEVIFAESKTLLTEVKALQSLKSALGLPLRFGWNGDPCVPQQHPWSGADCQFDRSSSKWVIDGLGLDNQGLRGFLPDAISKLPHLQSINLSGNSIHGVIPSSLGAISSLEILDLSYNSFNGSIPEGLGKLTSLRILNLNGNSLSGRVPVALGGRLLHRASFNFTDNAGLCGIPGLRRCGPHLSEHAKIGIGIGVSVACLLLVTCLTCYWKRRQNILRAQRIAARDAPYAKARTHFSRDVQMTRPYGHDHTRTAAENGPSLLS